MTIHLARELAVRGYGVDLVLAQARGLLLAEAPAAVRIIDLESPRVRQAIPGLARYLRRERPRTLISRMYHANLAAIVAAAMSGTSTPTLVVEASHLSAQIARGRLGPIRRRLLASAYRRAAAVVGVSRGVSSDLVATLRLPSSLVHTVYNPVVEPGLAARAALPPPHIWFADRTRPTFLAVGRLCAEKDYATLIRALARLRGQRPVRLVIFGEGPERSKLERLSRELDVARDVVLPGFCAHPQAAMRRAAGFALSSQYEGLPNALIEALACGCPVVATNCPSGPDEILAAGRWGELTPVGDAAALAAALGRLLDAPPDRAQLAARGAEFSVRASVDAYLALIERCAGESIPARRAA